MAIPATRFEFLDKDTNLTVKDFYKGTNLGTLNAVIQDVTKIAGQLKGLIGNNGQGALTAVLGTASKSPELQRMAKDGFSSVANITGLSSTGVTTFCQNALGSVKSLQGTLSSTVSAITGLSQQAQQTVLGTLNSVSGLANTVGLGGITKGMGAISSDVTGMANVINKVTNGNYVTTLTHSSSLSSLITGISKQGYASGLPGVFTAISNAINNPQVLLSSGNVLITNLSKSGNTGGMMDVMNSSIGSELKSVNPNISQIVTNGYTVSSGNNAITMSDSFSQSMTNMDSQWNKSITGEPSIANMSSNSDLTNSITYQAKNETTAQITSHDIVPQLSPNSVNSALLRSSTYINSSSQLYGVPVMSDADLGLRGNSKVTSLFN
jgi:hypothetical protein